LINLQNAKIAKQAAAKSLRDAAKADKLVADRGTVNYTEELKCMTLH